MHALILFAVLLQPAPTVTLVFADHTETITVVRARKQHRLLLAHGDRLSTRQQSRLAALTNALGTYPPNEQRAQCVDRQPRCFTISSRVPSAILR